MVDTIRIERAGLLNRERLYHQIVETGLEGIWIVAADGETLFANQRMADILGTTVAELMARSAYDFVFPEDEATARLRYESVRHGESPEPDFRFRRKDGGEVWAVLTAAPLEDEEGRFLGVLGKIIDVSRRRQAEWALAQSEREYQNLLENLSLGVYRTTPDGAILYANRAFVRMLGYTDFAEISSRDLEDELETGYSRAEFKRQLEECDEINGLETVWKIRKGATLYIREHARCIRTADGRVKYYEGTVEDITERRRAEEQLKESEMRYRVFVEQSTEAIWRFETECPIPVTLPEDEQIEWIYRYGYLAECNTVMAEMYGFSAAQEILGARLVDMLTPEDPGNLDYLRAFIRADYRLNKMETNELDRFGQPKHFVNSLVGIIEDGCLVRAWGMQRDTTEQKRLEREREHLNALLEQRVSERTAELERANQELESFTYSVSHDLRAPLRFAAGLLDMLDKRAGSALDPTSQGYLEASLDTISEAGDLIEELLAFAKLAHTQMRSEPVDMAEVFRESVLSCHMDSIGREVSWVLGELPIVSGDAAMLRLVARNLVSNALKYTRPRRAAVIEISACEEAAAYVFAIRDNGVGFDPKEAGSLFKPFQRLHTAAEFEGTGIGLAHVRRIVERHGGRVWAEGRKGAGAVFYFSLPKDAK